MQPCAGEDAGMTEAREKQARDLSEQLDASDRRILDIIQSEFPLAPRPYLEIGRKLNMPEEEVFRRVCHMRESGIIRRLGANFQSSRLGFVSTLCAASVPADKLDDFVALVNAEPGVTHNYLRDHLYNVWFTLISPGREAQLATLEALTRASGIEILNLPATRFFKIRVDFPMSEDNAGEGLPEKAGKPV